MLVRDILDRRTATATAKVTPKAKVTATTSAAAAPPLVGLELLKLVRRVEVGVATATAPAAAAAAAATATTLAPKLVGLPEDDHHNDAEHDGVAQQRSGACEVAHRLATNLNSSDGSLYVSLDSTIQISPAAPPP